jgi:hypothetical protein
MTVITIDRVGNIERVSATNISGWYINSVDNKPALLRLYADSVFILEFTAGEERPDVVAGGFNKAECGFRIDLPEAVRNAVSLEIIDALDNVLQPIASSPCNLCLKRTQTSGSFSMSLTLFTTLAIMII